MSILIRGMEMPKNCKDCPFSDHEAWCLIPGSWKERYYCPEDERSEHCPLIELPPHSDLVDRNKLLAEYDRQHKGPAGGARRIMEQAEAVIEAEGSET